MVRHTLLVALALFLALFLTSSVVLAQWQPNGTPVSTTAGDQYNCTICSDGAGGAIITWQDTRGGIFDVYAQRMDASGVPMWAASSGVTPVPVNFLGSANDTVLVDAGAPATTLYYIVTAYDVHANQGPKSNEASVSALTGVGNLPPITALTVLQNYPNPFNGITRFDVGLPGVSDISVEVYDVAGRRVHSQSLQKQKAGWQRVNFDGRDDAGKALSSGVYFCRITANGNTVTRKMVIAR